MGLPANLRHKVGETIPFDMHMGDFGVINDGNPQILGRVVIGIDQCFSATKEEGVRA